MILYIFLICVVGCGWNNLAGATYVYQTLYLTVPVNHFGFANNDTFQLRYLLNNTFWSTGGPIFLYTGNEGNIELFAQNTGFVWEIASKFNALVVFAEHRYYGKSLPYGDKSYSDPAHLGYLTSTQALADYVFLINYIQEGLVLKNNGKMAPVIAFGGSYGGMLAAWMRLKYPYIIYGAVASSAPIFQLQGLTKCNTYNEVVADVFKVSSKHGECVKNIKNSWKELRNMTSSLEGRAWLSKEWKLCKPLNTTEDTKILIDSLIEIYGNLAMINYPYATDFLTPVPAYPVRALCAKLEESNLSGKTLLTAIGNAISVYTNYTSKTPCFNVNQTSSNLDDKGWSFQACTEIVMPFCTDDKNEMFEPVQWNFAEYSENCFKQFGVRVKRDDLAILEYGGKGAEYSNVVFTNGLLDPWSPGGLLKSKTQSVYAILIPDAAHHLDLRPSNPDDPESVINARLHIQNILHVWLKMYKLVKSDNYRNGQL